jgi:hypothetical protein
LSKTWLMKKLLSFSCIAIALFSCQEPHKIAHVTKAFYYWKSNDYGDFSAMEDSLLRIQKPEKLYIKFFEVSRDETLGNIPNAKTQLDFKYYSWSKPNLIDSVTIVPTIFIKNEVFLKSNRAEIDTLVANVSFLIDKYNKEKFNDRKIEEYQMDCDWTPKSRDNYFYFLTQLKKTSNKQLSCTLRLYPYKYPEKMGVPPVDKVMLMCYNLIGPFDDQNKNSILDTNELSSYLDTDKKYPLHLDIVLPVFSWMHVYHNDRFSNLVSLDKQGMKAVLKSIKPLWYEVQKDTLIDNVFLRIGDKVKYEEITASKIDESIKIIKKNVSFDNNVTVSLFHLDHTIVTNFTNEEVTRFFADFSR